MYSDTEPDKDRRGAGPRSARVVAGVTVRDDDIEPTRSLHWVAVLFRVMSGLLFVLLIAQLALGLTSMVDLSYGVLFADAVRLLILAGLLWAAGALADLFVKSHHDLRAMRILLTRVAYKLGEDADAAPRVRTERAPGSDPAPGNRDDGYRH
ncbi:MAG: hypothetical protein M3R55_07110 [Acidobacteriota bacterium]|nr:hypothetical protein [Acidobacteriota bacterium]